MKCRLQPCWRPVPGTSLCTFPIARGSSASTHGDPDAVLSRCWRTSINGSPPTRRGSPTPSKSNPSERKGMTRMPVAIITGAGGLIGSEAVEHFVGEGFDVVGIENDMRARFFGPESSTSHVTERLVAELSAFRVENVDIRDAAGVERIFREAGKIE